MNIDRVRNYLLACDFPKLFNELGWDNANKTHTITIKDHSPFTMREVATKSGYGVFACEIDTMPDYATRGKIENVLSKNFREHLLVFYTSNKDRQIWIWTRRELGKPNARRERTWHKGQTGEPIIQALKGIEFTLADELEKDSTLSDTRAKVKKSFDLEKVTKKFYERFKKEHDTFMAFIDGIPDDDLQSWYASVMLNRLMFLYFIQQKGFLDDDQRYLQNRLDRSHGNFYAEFLIPLFFEGLANPHPSSEMRQLLGKTPYLNGGIFMPHSIEERYGQSITIPDDAFEKIFTFFDSYHWRLDDRPTRKDDEINPDVLGYIFEKYINQKQMGAYYTKEDITEYISKNTIIPFLFDRAYEECKVAFDGSHSVWRLAQENPDAYIYDAVKHGADLPLPDHIARGVNNVAMRDQWNTPAPSEYGLPTEIWRETVARRQRYEEVKSKLSNGEIRSINDFITYNLDIIQFAQDVIEKTDSSDLIRAFWNAITSVTVLDPTCGSGAFLFAALNILESLYEACIERMGGFIEDRKRESDYADFVRAFDGLDKHANRKYFVYKSIIINNLFGVDIMEEAIEICKLRLFLKLVAQEDDAQNIEPLPDIDFNIRVGNTLVGFATKKEIEGDLLAQGALGKIKDMTEEIDNFREAQLDSNVPSEEIKILKNKITKAQKAIANILDIALAPQHGFGIDQVSIFQTTHKPFHWYAEFYNEINSGGFDVIIGNPPYVEYSKVEKKYTVHNYRTEYGKNLYIFTVERSTKLLSYNGMEGMIVPISLLNVRNTHELRNMMQENYGYLWVANYAIRPAKLFEGVEQRLTIFIGKKDTANFHQVFSSKYHQWYTDERPHLFSVIELSNSTNIMTKQYIPKIGNRVSNSIIRKINSLKHETIEKHLKTISTYRLLFHRTPGYWIRALDFDPYFKSPTSNKSIHHIRELFFADEKIMKFVGGILSSSMYFFWFFAIGNCRNLTLDDVKNFPIGHPHENIFQQIVEQFDSLMKSYRLNAKTKSRGETEFDEINWGLSKQLVDKIDRILAEHYGFTDEELDFIINYDIKYRMGDSLDEVDGEE